MIELEKAESLRERQAEQALVEATQEYQFEQALYECEQAMKQFDHYTAELNAILQEAGIH